jgi:hypothetical protein
MIGDSYISVSGSSNISSSSPPIDPTALTVQALVPVTWNLPVVQAFAQATAPGGQLPGGPLPGSGAVPLTAAVPVSTDWIPGIPNNYLIIGVGALVLLMVLKK